MEEFNLRYGKTSISLSSNHGFRAYFELPDCHMHVYPNDTGEIEVHLYFREITRKKYSGVSGISSIENRETLKKFMDTDGIDLTITQVTLRPVIIGSKVSGRPNYVHGGLTFQATFTIDKGHADMRELIEHKKRIRKGFLAFIDSLLPVDPLVQEKITKKVMDRYNARYENSYVIDDLPF